ncbi:MAG: glycosyltransferase [Phycisphaerae bacterium]|nr:glycosyltransferase [Phycisphaerae bacterium]
MSERGIEDRPLITFALFAYNQEQFIEEAIRGAFSQTYSPLEIILSDDCSTDRTFEIMKEMAQRYEGPHKIILNRNENNLGICAHVNRVILDVSSGDLIVLAAGDDVSIAERTETLWCAWAATNRKYSLMASGYIKVDAGGRAIADVAVEENKAITDKTELMANTGRRQGCVLMGCTFCLHRSIFTLFGPLIIRNIEDGAIVARAGLLTGVLAVCAVLVKYRSHEKCITAAKDARAAVVKFARMRQETYLQTLVDIQSMRDRAGPDLREVEGIEHRIRRLLAMQDLIVYFAESRCARRVILSPIIWCMFRFSVAKEIHAACFPRLYSAFKGLVHWRKEKRPRGRVEAAAVFPGCRPVRGYFHTQIIVKSKRCRAIRE